MMLLDNLGIHNIGVQSLIILAVTFVADVISSLILHVLSKKERDDSKRWFPIVIFALKTPLHYIVWFAGLSSLGWLWSDALGTTASNYLYKTIVIAFIGCVTWFFIRLIRRTQRLIFLNLNKKAELRGLRDQGTFRAISKILEGLVFCISGLFILSFLNISISGLVTFGGLSAAAVALSTRDTLGNFLGGVMIYVDQPFLMGDSISSPDRDIEGVVENIGWRLTTIRRKNKTYLYLPNGMFNSISIINASRKSHTLLLQKVGLRYQDIPLFDVIMADIRALFLAHPMVDSSDPNYPLLINLDSCGEISLHIVISGLIKTNTTVVFRAIQDELMTEVLTIITRHGGVSTGIKC